MSEDFELSFEDGDDQPADLSDEELLALVAGDTINRVAPEAELEVDSVDLSDLLPMPPDPQDLAELELQAGVRECTGSPVSYVDDRRSSLVLPPAPVRMEDVFALTTRSKRRADAVASNILLALSKWARNKPKALDRRLKLGSLFALANDLEARQADLLEGEQVAIIVTGEQVRRRWTPAQLLAKHYTAVPIDGLVMIGLAGTAKRLKVDLQRMGLAELRDYEFLGQESLTASELVSFKRLQRVKSGETLFVIRRISRTQPKL